MSKQNVFLISEKMIQLQGFFDTDTDLDKTSFSVFITILYIKVLYILVMTLYVLSRYNEIASWIYRVLFVEFIVYKNNV